MNKDNLQRDFVNGCVTRLAANLETAFGNQIGPLDEMLVIAHETAVIIAIEVGMPPMADSIYNFYEKLIKEVWIPQRSAKRTKRHRH